MKPDRLRLMRQADVGAVAALLLRANEEHLARFPAEVARSYRAELAEVGERWGRTEAYVVERDGIVLGTVTFVRDAALDAHPWPAGGAVLRFLAVEPAARGQGLGERLTAVCVARAREERASYLGLHTAPVMRAARELYERQGFERAPEHDFDPAAHYAGATDPQEPAWGLAYLLRLRPG